MTSNSEIDPNSIVARIISELEDQPAARPLLLRTLLTDEFLAMPARMLRIEQDISTFKSDVGQRFDAVGQRFDAVGQRFDAVDQRFDAMDQRFDGMDQRFDGMDQRFDAMDQRFDGMDRKMDTMQGQLNNLTGTEYQRRAVRRAPRLVKRYLDVQNGEVLMAINRQNGHSVTELVNRATQTGTITEDDADELDRTDIILRGETPEGAEVYVIGEVSITIGDEDVDRAAERARIMQMASGATTHAAVIGSYISTANQERAEFNRVTVIAINE